MSEQRWESVHLSEIDPACEPDPGEQEWLPVRHRLGIAAVGVNA